MRKIVAKRIRKYAARNNYSSIQEKELKRIWNKIPRPRRNKIGKEME